MKKINIAYWIFTGLTVLGMGFSAIPDLMVSTDAIKIVVDLLHYPKYFVVFIGVAKLLGVIALLIPGFPRIKEWAYAGLTFDLIGAMYSMYAIGQPVVNWIGMMPFLIILAGSYYFYHKRLAAKGVTLAVA